MVVPPGGDEPEDDGGTKYIMECSSETCRKTHRDDFFSFFLFTLKILYRYIHNTDYVGG